MKQAHHTLTIETQTQGLVEVTGDIAAWLAGQDIDDGLLTVFIRHTSASLVIQENADAAVQRDLETFFSKIAPEDASLYRHDSEGPDDMPAHIKAALTQTSLGIPVQDGRMLLGTWQGIYLFEHRRRPHSRRIALHFIGD